MLFFIALLISIAINIDGTEHISLTFNTYPPKPKFGEFLKFSAVVRPPVESIYWSSLLKQRLKTATFLWYSKSYFDEEFSLIGSGRILILKVDSYFNAIYNLTLMMDSSLTVIDYSRLVSLQHQFGIEISINNQSFRGDFHRKYRTSGRKFDFRCRLIGDPNFFSLIFPAKAKCDKHYIEEIPQIHATDFVFKNCGIIPLESYGCQIANISDIYAKTFEIIIANNT